MRRIRRILLFSLFLSLGLGCVESEEGCLDPEASNFDPDADDGCCCTYPALTMNWEYRRGDTLYFPGDTLDLGTGQTVALLDFNMLGAEVVLVTPNGLVEVEEVISASEKIGADTMLVRIEDDAFLLNPIRFTQTISGYRYSGTIEGLNLELFPQNWKKVIPSSIDDGSHPWRRAEDEGLWSGDSMSMISIGAIVDGDTLNRIIYPNEAIGLSWPLTLIKQPSEGILLQAQLYLDVLLRNVDLRTMTDDDIMIQITANADSALFVFP